MILALLGTTVAIVAFGLWIDAKSERLRKRDEQLRGRYADTQAGEIR